MKTKNLFGMLSRSSPLIMMAATTLHAAVIELNQTFDTGAVPPAGQTPWLTLSTTNLGAGLVQINMDATGLTGSEIVTEWCFNLDSLLDPKLLSATTFTQTGFFLLPTITLSADGYKADGDGHYDIHMRFDNSGDSTHRFGAGDELQFVFSYSGSGSFSASSFNVLSKPEVGASGFFSAAHVTSTGTDGLGSAWIAAVPEPSAALQALLATGAGLMLSRRRRPD